MENDIETDVAEENTPASEEKTVEKKEENFKEKYLYVLAEMDNLRKRTEREKDNIIKYGSERILKGLIEVVDNFERTINAIKDDKEEKVKSIRTGVEMVRKQFLDVLSCNGLVQIETAEKIFDPNFHEAVGKQDLKGKEENEIVEEYQKGYMLNGRVLRASKVIVCQKNNL